MDGLPEFIYHTGLRRYRFIANCTDWTIRRSHGGLREQIIRLHRRPTPSTGAAVESVRDLHRLARHSCFVCSTSYAHALECSRRSQDRPTFRQFWSASGAILFQAGANGEKTPEGHHPRNDAGVRAAVPALAVSADTRPQPRAPASPCGAGNR